MDNQHDQFQRLCRICTTETNGILIYSDEGKENSLEEKIKKFLSIQVSEEDELPKMVCSVCNSKLNVIQQLAETAAKTQLKLIEYLQLPKSDDKSPLENEDNEPWYNVNDVKHEQPRDDDGETNSENESLKGSLLHSILTKRQDFPAGDITELEVTIDPMLFIEEEEEIESKPDSNNSSEGDVVHLAELKPYQCTICPRGFNSDVSLRNHLWSHLPSRKFLSTTDLNKYQVPVNLHMSKLYNTQCLCQICGRVYPTRSTLRAHQITHSNLRPHKCSLCEKTFKRNQDLKFHINQHTGERPYRCPYCPKAFASSGNCFSHRKRMHPKQLARDKRKVCH